MSLNERLISVGAAACTTDSVNPFGPNNAFSSNIALYQLDGNANDTTTNYNGTPTNITYAAGYIDQAAVFNGTNSYISISATNTTPLDLSQENYSISAWVKFDTFSGDRGIISKWGTSASLRSILWWVSNGSIKFIEGGSADSIHSSTATLSSTGTWYHLVYTRSASESKIFINGSLDSTFARTQTIRQGGTEPYYLGSQSAGAFKNLDGSIDQVRIFDKAISAENVATLYAETAATASNTNPLGEGSGVALYTLDYDGSDASGLYDGVPTNVEFGVEGQINYGARFNGSSSGINLPSSLNTSVIDATGAFSISMWINANDISTIQYLFCSNNSNNVDLGINTNNQGVGKIVWTIYNTSYSYLISTTTITTNTWYNIVVTYNNGLSELFINGASQGTITKTLLESSIEPTLGYRNTGGSVRFNGSIDQVRIFQSALNSTQVTQLYNETACVYTCTTDTVDYPITNLAYYKLDNTAEDETGIYDGTATNVNYTFGRFGQAAVFNGSSSYISGTVGATATTSFSMWVKINDPSTSSGEFIQVFDNNNFAIFIYSGKLNIQYASGSNSNGVAWTISNASNWNHIAGTFTSSSSTLYVNGVQKTESMNSWVNAGSVPYIGNRNALDGYFNGEIDQVRIFSSALTSTQVQSLYNEKPCADTSTFKTVLYTGNGSTQYVSNVGFEPDLVWVKNRNNAGENHNTTDVVSGFGKVLYPNLTNAQVGSDNTYFSQLANGFSINTNNGNISTNNYVAWNWKAGGDAVNIGVNSITGSTPSIASDVSANTAAGFSIVKYTGNGTSGATVGHGLTSVAPQLIIVKSLNTIGGSSKAWTVYAEPLGNTKYLYLNETLAAGIYNFWNNTSPDDNVFTVSSDSNVNSSSGEYIAYCWHSVAGYSKIGSYTGNTTTLPSITLGFTPSFLMVKRTDSGDNWLVFDNKRNTTNPTNLALIPNSSAIESVGNLGNGFNFLSNGFQLASTDTGINANAGEYLYMAFA